MIYLDYVWLSTKVVSNLFKFIGRKRISYEVFEEIEEKKPWFCYKIQTWKRDRIYDDIQ